MKKLKSALTIGILLLVSALLMSGCGWTAVDNSISTVSEIPGTDAMSPAVAKDYIEKISVGTITDKVVGVIMPHHLLVAGFMDKFYQQLVAELKQEKRVITRVILISPNHFGYGFNFIQSTDVSAAKNFDVKLDVATIRALEKRGVLKIEPKYLPREHGVTTHFSFLKKYFPQAKVIPVILKRDIPKDKLDALVKELTKVDSEEETLVIGSIDFSHYSGEEWALENDSRMLSWLSAFGNCENISEVDCQVKNFADVEELYKSKDTFTKDAVGVDSPEAVYVMNDLMRNLGAKNFQLWRRTSSASLIGTLDPKENTSHLFVSYGL